MQIMIVDDNLLIRNTIKSILASPEVDFIDCIDGALALDQYRSARPDWVLMDIKMPGMNGIQATRNIVAEFPDARIVIVTNFDDKEFRAEAEKAGARSYVLKEDLIRLRQVCNIDGQ